MKAEADKLQIESLTNADILELETKTKVTRLPSPKPSTPGAHHDPGTISIVVSAAGPILTLLGVMVVRKITSSRRRIKITRITKDEQIWVELDEKAYSSDTPKADVIKAVAEGLKIDPAAITKALAGQSSAGT